MILAYDYPLLSLIWSILWFFLLVAWLMTVFHVIADVFRSHDLGGVAKAVWLLFVLFLPFLGVLAYLIFRGDKMAQRSIDNAQASEAAFRNYVQHAAGGDGPADQLEKLAALHAAGTISDEELKAGKAKILA